MGFVHRLIRAGSAPVLLLGLFMGGCAPQQTVSVNRILRQQAILDFSGLKDVQTVETVKSRLAPPETWEQLVPKKASLYTDVQWRAPSRMSGVGVIYVRMPLPLPASTLMWLAKREYTKKSAEGRLIGEWTDAQGRPWFEAENSTYHVRGFVVTKGWEAWIVYAGYKTLAPPNPTEMSLALRSMHTVVPTPMTRNYNP